MNLFKNTFVCVTLVIIQLFCLVFINTQHLLVDYFDLNNPDQTQSKNLKIGLAIENSPIFKIYSNYTGTNSGYGFFAPNVGSEFVMTFTVLDCENKLLGEHQSPQSLKQNESRSRFNLCAYPMMERIMLGEQNLIYSSYFNVMLHQIAEDINSNYNTGHKVVSEIYMHQYPKIEEALNGNTEKFQLLERFTYRF